MRLIDADALREEVNKKKVVGRFNAISLIDNAPTVAIEAGGNCPLKSQGEWAEFEGGYRCSNCDDIEAYTPNFCPNCGADMRGETDDG